MSAPTDSRHPFSLQCPNCGDDVFDRATDIYQDDEQETCRECGATLAISIDDSGDEPEAYIAWRNDEGFEDAGQPRCDRSCGAIAEYDGTPCSWTCERTKASGWTKPHGETP